MIRGIVIILLLIAAIYLVSGFANAYRECRTKKTCDTLSDIDYMRVLDHTFAK